MPASSTDLLPARAATSLVSWYEANARDLPWRRTSDPYSILVSEVMLQQTRVETVVERYRQFLSRFPDLASLATATEEQVLATWSGLGYYRRARSLHRLAKDVMREHGGVVPADHAALLKLPGIGAYTAAAVSSIAYGLPRLTIDGNVERVLCRLLAETGDPRRSAIRRRLQGAAADSLAVHSPGMFNQALMELGATVCLPATPRCGACPCEPDCLARRRGIESTIPPKRERRVHDVKEAAAVLARDGNILLFREQRPGVLQRMWEFPTLDSRLAESPGSAEPDLPGDLAAHLQALAIEVSGLAPIGRIRHGITTRRIECHVFRPTEFSVPADLSPADRPLAQGWFEPSEIEKLPLAASTRKILRLLQKPN